MRFTARPSHDARNVLLFSSPDRCQKIRQSSCELRVRRPAGPGGNQCRVIRPVTSVVLRLALDTGATATMINSGPLVVVGYDPSLAPQRVQVTTGSGVEYVPRVQIVRFRSL